MDGSVWLSRATPTHPHGATVNKLIYALIWLILLAPICFIILRHYL
jgi:hypothetical protein